MRLILFFILLPLLSYSQIYHYIDDKDGKPTEIAGANGTDLTRINECKKPTFACSTGFSGKSFSSDTTYNPSQPSFEFSVTPDQGYALNVTSFEARLRRSDQGSIFVRYAYSINGGITWVDNSDDLTPKNSTCGDAKKREWVGFTPFSFEGKIIFRITGFNAKSGSGTLQVLNIIVGGTITQTIIDNDGDGHVSENDCNDSDSTIHPNAIEKCNSIDDNCNNQIDDGLILFKYYPDENGDGYADDSTNFILTCSDLLPDGYVTVLAPLIDLAITNTKITIPPYIWSATAADLGYTGSAEKCAADPIGDPVECRLLTEENNPKNNIYDLVKGQNWYAIAFPEGKTTPQWQVIIGDSNVTRMPIKNIIDNGGYNCQCTFCIGGLCICPCKINNEIYDFFNATVALKNKLNAKGIVFVNVERGDTRHQWEQIQWIVQQYNPEYLVYGQEGNGTNSLFKGKIELYLTAVKPLLDSVHKYYPYIINVADAAQVIGTGSNSGNNMTWNKSIKQWNAIYNLFDAGDFYTQLNNEFQHLTGNVAEDTATLKKVWQIHYALYDTLYARLGMPLFNTQFTTSEAFPEDAIVYPEQWIVAGSYTLPGYDLLFDYNITHNNIIQGKIMQTIKNTTGKGQYDITGRCATLMANVFDGSATYLQMADYGNIKIFGSKIGDEYRVIVYNNSGKDAKFPTTLSLDGYILKDVGWTGGTYYSAASFTSKEIIAYTPTEAMKGLSVGYRSFKIPISK